MAVNWSLQHKRDTAANWTASNPTLLAGQLGIETDNLTTTPKFKIGDGTSTWTALPYFYGGSASAQNLNNVLSVGSSTSGQNMTITADDTVYFGASGAGIYNSSFVANPNHLFLTSDINTNGSHILLKDGGNEWHDESASAFITLSVGSVVNNAIQLDESNDKISIFSGANGLNLQNDTYLNSVTASRLLSTDSNKKIAPLTGTGIVTLTAGVIGYDTNTYLTTSSASGTYLTISNAALTYQPLDADLTSWAGVTRYSGFDTFVATPSSANFAALLTDETGSGKVVFDTGATVSNLTLDRISLAGNISTTAWTTNGIGIKHTARTITDTTSSGTVAAAYTNLLGGNTIAASNSTTFSDYYSTYISSPSAGTNVTFTRSWSLGLAGNLDIGGNIRIGGVTSTGVTGSGALVFGTSPTFTTDITTPKVIGSASSGGSLTLQSTSHATKGNIVFGTSAYDEVNNRLGIGTTTPTVPLDVVGNVTISNILTCGQINGYTNDVQLYAKLSSGKIVLGCNVGGTVLATFRGTQTTGASISYDFTPPTNTGQTASTEIPVLKLTGVTKTWAAGAITTQRWNYFTANTAAFASASTITNSYGLYVEAATAGSNATITNNYAAGFSGRINVLSDTATIMIGSQVGSTSRGAIYINQSSPDTTNFALSAHQTANQTYLNGAGGVAVLYNGSIQATFGNLTATFGASLASYDFLFSSTAGTKLGTATTQKIGFWNATPIVQPANTTNIDDVLINTGLWASGATYATFTKQLSTRIAKRITTITSSATPTINTDNCDAVTITALAANITSFTTNLSGTPNNFDELTIRIKDDGTARTLAWGASFEAKGVALPTTTVISKVLTVKFIYDSVTSKWGCVASVSEY